MSMGLPRSTHKDEIKALLEGSPPLGGERLIDYNIFLTEAFGLQGSVIDQLSGPGNPDQMIDGYQNDDSYRSSRHLALRPESGLADANEENLRENSLARQLAEKKDQPATIRLIRRRRADEMAALSLVEPRVPWQNLIPPNTKFFLERVQENREEKVQVIDTFGEWVAFFFGRKPEVYSYSGTLLNAKNHDWKNEFQENYDHFLRGSQAVQNRATVVLQYDDVLVEGYMLNCSIQMAGQADKAVPFSFNMLVLNRSPLNPRRMIGLRIERSGSASLETALFSTMQDALNLANEGRVDELETFLLMREYFSGNYVPSAGKAIHRPATGNIESETSLQPGQKSGLINAKPVSQPFTSRTKNSIDQSGVTLLA